MVHGLPLSRQACTQASTGLRRLRLRTDGPCVGKGRGLRGRGCIPAVRTRPVRRGRRTILYAEGAINERLASFDWELVDV